MRGDVHRLRSAAYRRLTVWANVGAVLAFTGCGLEGPIINAGTRDKSTLLPDAADNVVIGAVEGAPDGTVVKAYQASGKPFGGISGVVAGSTFEVRFPGNTLYTGVRLEARWSGGQALALVPLLPRQKSVLDPENLVDLAQEAPGMSPLSATSTAFTLILWGKVLSEGKGAASLSPGVIRQSAALLTAQLTGHNAEVVGFVDMVRSLLSGAGDGGLYPFPGLLEEGGGVGDLVDADFLAAHAPGTDTEAFEQALLAAAAEVDVAVCLAGDRIRVVFLCDMGPGAMDGNCNEADPFKWAIDDPDKTIYFTGGIHETTPVCGEDIQPPACLDQATIDAANQVLGNWSPNMVKMFDDGTRGDGVKGDGLYTLALELPYFPPGSLATGGRGVRIGYKYSWGLPADGWTGTEEWPGNQRLMELADLNGDGMVTRADVFGDEASNKDKANALSLGNGGCGPNYWENEIQAGCAHDTRENRVDPDGGCQPDTWPQPGSASPITVDCPM